MKIICIGRNYRAHAKELKNEVPTEPVIFLKPQTAIPPKKHPFFYPDFSQDVHFEVELVVKINKIGKHIEERFAHKYYDEIGIGIDFTARDIQEECKKKGLPWEKAKAFDGSAALGEFIHKKDIEDLNSIEFSLKQNGVEKQKGISSDMIFSIDQLISYVSKYFTLKIGDLIYTGTPKGVGPIEKGDLLEAFIYNKKLLEIKVR